MAINRNNESQNEEIKTSSFFCLNEYKTENEKTKNPRQTFVDEGSKFKVAVWTGLEPATPCVTGRYSNQLNYQTVAVSGCKYKSVFCICKGFLQKFYKNFFRLIKYEISTSSKPLLMSTGT